MSEKAIKQTASSHISIAEQITEGSISIKSIAEFKSILKIFPNDPALHKAFSALLIKKKQPAAAVKSYDKATRLFIDAGKILQAIDTKMLQWRIKSPSPVEARRFYSTLHKGRFNESPLKSFFQRLTYKEMVAFVSKLARVTATPGKMVKKAGEQENELFFVVSGNLKETVFRPIRKQDDSLFRKRASDLNENHFFGDVYPFKNETASKSYIESTSRTEMLRITKSNLIKICEKYPNVELGLIDLYKVRKQSGNGDARSSVRKIGRHQLPL